MNIPYMCEMSIYFRVPPGARTTDERTKVLNDGGGENGQEHLCSEPTWYFRGMSHWCIISWYKKQLRPETTCLSVFERSPRHWIIIPVVIHQHFSHHAPQNTNSSPPFWFCWYSKTPARLAVFLKASGCFWTSLMQAEYKYMQDIMTRVNKPCRKASCCIQAWGICRKIHCEAIEKCLSGTCLSTPHGSVTSVDNDAFLKRTNSFEEGILRILSQCDRLPHI